MKSVSDGTQSKVIVFAGDIHGQWRRLAGNLRQLQRTTGKIDVVFSVGDAQAVRSVNELRFMRVPSRHSDPGDFPELVAGEFELPVPVYFIGGNHEPWEALDDAGPGEWAPNVHFLGRSGITNVHGLRVAFLSGIYSPKVSESSIDRSTVRERTYWNAEELVALEQATPGVDILLTHDWPDEIESTVPGHPVQFGPGNSAIRQLSERLQPKVHACGHHHRSLRETRGSTQLVCLADSSAGRASLAAFAVDKAGFTEIGLGIGLT